MKKVLGLLAVMAWVFSGFGVAWAIPFTWTDVYSAIEQEGSNIFFGSGGVESYSYTHDINDDGFDVGQDLVWTYDLSVGLFDDGGDGKEVAFIDLPGWFADRTVEIDYEDVELGVSFAGLIKLNTSGQLDVEIERKKGDFYFAVSSLFAHGWESNRGTVGTSASPVPEPQTMLLLGCGLVGLAGVFRKKLFGRIR